MVGKYFAPSFRAIMILLATGVALYSLRYYGVLVDRWLDVDPKIRTVIAHVPIQALMHMLIAPIALLLGPFQFIPGLRAKYPQAHRWSGRVYVTACVVAGTGGLAASPYASGGPVAGLGFGILAVLWLGTTLGAWRAAVQRQYALHRLLMRFSYAMTFGAVTLRLQIPLGFALGYPTYSAMSVWLAYTSWIPNVIVVALYSIAEALRRPMAPATVDGEMTAL
ncbi:DUF2306 domain-containing protein [Rhizobium sp. BR 315]|uniref:DUF2306 domain-containing protein n=1 Tax=Rhizobium sp. BR 315 TaxID=3040014 RepID=UPI003D3444F1